MKFLFVSFVSPLTPLTTISLTIFRLSLLLRYVHHPPLIIFPIIFPHKMSFSFGKRLLRENALVLISLFIYFPFSFSRKSYSISIIFSSFRFFFFYFFQFWRPITVLYLNVGTISYNLKKKLYHVIGLIYIFKIYF